MKTEKSRTFLRNIFIFITAAGLIFNLIFDLGTLRKNKDSDLMGERVVNSLKAFIHLEKINQLLGQTNLKTQKNSLENEFEQLKISQSEIMDPKSLDQLKEAMTLWSGKANEVISPIRARVVDQIARLQLADLHLNTEVESEMSRALMGDLILIAALLLLFALTLHSKRKVEQDLRASLVTLRESVSRLEQKALSQKIASKIAVHDLKNPIGTIMGFAQLLHDDPKSELSVTEFSNRIRQISEGSLVLVESLLLEKESDEAIHKTVDLVPIIKEISSQLQVQASKKDQRIEHEFKVQQALVMGDSLKFEEMVSNALSNAIKYSPRGAQLKIKIYELNGFLKLEFEDQGPGFSEEDKKNAFQFGRRLSATPTDNESSTGYGLYIIKQIVEASHGNVKLLDSSSGQGACVQISFPH